MNVTNGTSMDGSLLLRFHNNQLSSVVREALRSVSSRLRSTLCQGAELEAWTLSAGSQWRRATTVAVTSLDSVSVSLRLGVAGAAGAWTTVSDAITTDENHDNKLLNYQMLIESSSSQMSKQHAVPMKFNAGQIR
jgi:hypothetical protein